jgi:hypothetical protein
MEAAASSPCEYEEDTCLDSQRGAQRVNRLSGDLSHLYQQHAALTVAPNVDATIFWNRSTFSVSTLLPYRAQHVQFWTEQRDE